MEAKESPLEYKGFSILKSKCDFILVPQDDNNTLGVQEIMKIHPVDIDYRIQFNSELNVFFVFLKLIINPSKSPGYSIFTECCGIFKINGDHSEDQKSAFIYQSGLSLCISNLRSYVANMTSNFPLGKFDFHSIDLNELINSKERGKEQEKES